MPTFMKESANDNGRSTAQRLRMPAAVRQHALPDVFPRSTKSFSRQGLALSHALIGAATLAVPSK